MESTIFVIIIANNEEKNKRMFRKYSVGRRDYSCRFGEYRYNTGNFYRLHQ